MTPREAKIWVLTLTRDSLNRMAGSSQRLRKDGRFAGSKGDERKVITQMKRLAAQLDGKINRETRKGGATCPTTPSSG